MASVRRVFPRLLSLLLASVLALTGLLPALPASAASATPSAGATAEPQTAAPRPKDVIVRWAPGVPRSQVVAAADRIGFKVVRESAKLGRSLVTSTRPGTTPEALLKSLRANRLISEGSVEVVYSAQTAPPTPNDPMFSTQWGLENTGQTGGKTGADISARMAWTHTKGSKDVVVAVVDTGMDIKHADLAANIWTNPGEIPGNGIDDDGNGYVDDIHGYDFGNRDATVFDPEQGEQHATHVAGIIGAATDNGTGVSGVNWNVTIMPVKFLMWGSGTDFDGADAIRYAVDNGADVINCSWGGGESDVLGEAVAYAASHGVLVVTAAGNDGMDVDESPFYPGCIDSTAIVNVAATDHNDQLAFFSNFGDNVDIAAPGVEITSTLPYECGAVMTDVFPYRVALLGFPVEDVAPAPVGREILKRSMAQLAPMTDSVFVVDDSEPEAMEETPGVRLAEYVDSLHAAGYSDVTTWSTEAQGAPPLSAMSDRTVVWFTGAMIAPFFNPMMTGSERAVLGAFLDGGGRLLLSTGDGVFDMIWWDFEWMLNYLRVEPGDVQAWGNGLKGYDGTAFEGLAGSLPADLGEAGSESLMPIDDAATPIIGLGGYGPLSGTSMAAPHVSGAAALLMAEFPSAGTDEIKDRLLNTVDGKPGLKSACAQGGRLNVYAGMQDFPGRPTIASPAGKRTLRGGRTETLAWTTSAHASAEQTFEAQIGLPATAFSTGFEGGTLAPFETSGANAWVTTSTAHAGSYGAVSGYAEGFSSMAATLTVPDGGGELSFWYRFEGDPMWCGGVVAVDEGYAGIWSTGEPTGGWKQATIPVPEGEHQVLFEFDQWGPGSPSARFGVDDLAIEGYDFQPLLTAPAGAASATFTAPALELAKVKLRMRSHLGTMTSAWSGAVDARVSLDATPPAAPDAFSAVPHGDGDVDLSWANPSAGEGAIVRVLRRLGVTPAGADDVSATVVYEGTALSVRDTRMKDGDDARYAAYAIDPADNLSGAALTAAAVVDHIAPPAATKLQAALSEGVVRLAWLSPPPASCSAVKVLRRTDTTPTGPSDPNATVVFDGTGSTASDYMLTRHAFSGTAYYAVFPRDPSGNVGPRAAVRLDVGMHAMAGTLKLAGGAAFCTTAAIEASSDVTGAVRMRFDLGDGYAPWEPYAATKALVLAPALDGLHVVKAEYENAEGARLELSARIMLELTPPQPPTALKAQPWNNRAKLTWTGSHSADVASYTIYRGDSRLGPWEEVASIEASAVGMVLPWESVEGWFRMTATDIAGMEGAGSDAVMGLPGPGTVRLAGADRYATSVLVSKRHFASADTVVLATGESFPDALSASGLAGSYDAPILLTRHDSLPATVSAEIARLGAKKVFVIGSTSAISTGVADSLETSYTVRRLFGADRYGTAAAVARELDAHETTAPTEVALVNGTSFADGTSIAAAAYAGHIPVLLTKRDALPAATKATIDWLEPEQVYLIGGPNAVSWDIEEKLADTAFRLAGSNRYDTAAQVGSFFAETGVLSYEFVAVASGRSFPDALTGGAAAGAEGGVVLLADPRTDATPELVDTVEMNAMSIGRLEILGGRQTLNDGVEGYLNTLLDVWGPIMPAPEMGDPGGRGEYPDEMG